MRLGPFILAAALHGALIHAVISARAVAQEPATPPNSLIVSGEGVEANTNGGEYPDVINSCRYVEMFLPCYSKALLHAVEERLEAQDLRLNQLQADMDIIKSTPFLVYKGEKK